MRYENLRVTASQWETLANDSNEMTRVAFNAAVAAINSHPELGTRFASNHPELIAAMVQASAVNWLATCLSLGMQDVGDAIQEAAAS